MKLLVIDDQFPMSLQIGHAVQDLRDCSVDWVSDPEELDGMLVGEVVDLAFVDLHYGRGKATGLTAQRVISESSPSTKTVVFSNEQEDNRILLLLASFYFFRPFAMVSKRASDEVIRAAVTAACSGAGELDFGDVDRYRKAAPLIAELITRPNDLPIWRSLTLFSERSAVAGHSGVGAGWISTWAEEKLPVVEKIRLEFLGHRPDLPRPIPYRRGREERQEDEKRRTYTAKLAPLHAFAMVHAEFFNARELDSLFEFRREVESAGDSRRRNRFGRRRER
ncbi:MULTISPECIES: hypothetical protein [unclassified Streptomyces]|uniref:hypothetical protein n=1 Tax=unclassified Streptomyces TaxID=2593676 RepID=UPI002DD89A5E|nr:MULTISPECIES: hypothetical protein [unclassified Streptomyces]WSF81759.1 hypothetical protein OIE70_00185 [Streptomyces sp. NBC_01744]WSC34126.1 hypothetical protein OHA08_00175 [Streptomyces sp. NBC_01763]WSC41932.1 hypothetical protein OHA08_44805 [Streptomyces sp. NBC_01763]WSC50924.1 hypothetical protein OG808_00175 [Streptomyces sp. NBC_01761]WSC58597.1 hypothetical protein OG808_44140 [Streptomyces sp. NBC_01761]